MRVLARRGGCFKDIIEYARENYRKRYRASLAFTLENIRIAIEVYKYGITNNVGVTVASRAISMARGGRPVYTRLANFIRELGLWDVETGSWVYIPCQLTTSFRYFAKRGEQAVRITATFPTPLGHDIADVETLGELLIIESMAALGYPAEFIDEVRMGLEMVEEEAIGEELYEFKNNEIEFTVDLEHQIRNRRYQYRVLLTERREEWLKWFVSRF